MFRQQQLTKEEMLGLDQERMIESIKMGWTPEAVKKFWGWSDKRFALLYRLVYEEVKDYLKLDNPENTEKEIMRVFTTNSKQPQVHEWVDPKDGKKWFDVSEFWGL